jgi:glucose-1-phosphatase
MLTNIDTIIFDLGGVILDISPKETERRFEELGITVTHEMFHITPEKNPFTQLEQGTISHEQFYNGVRENFKTDLSDEEIRYAWDGMLHNWTPERIDLILELKKEYKILLLSNTNGIHYETYTTSFQEQFGSPFEDLFHECYVSHEMGCRKPNLDIYEQLIKKSGITPECALFIDDTFLNIEGCEAAGIRGYHLTDGEDIRDILK